MQTKTNGVSRMMAFRQKHPKLGILIAIIGFPLVVFLEAVLLLWGWNSVIAASCLMIEPINVWQALLLMAICKICLGKGNHSAKGKNGVPKKRIDIKDFVPYVQ